MPDDEIEDLKMRLQLANEIAARATIRAQAAEARVGSRPGFNPPVESELLLAAHKIGLPEGEARKFLAYYGSNGWKVGKNPMKNWLMALTGWKVRWQEREGTARPQERQPEGDNF